MKRIALKLDPFCYRQFDPKNSSHIPYDQQKFEDKINQLYDEKLLKEGYAPFCKHIFVQNFTEAVASTIAITPENQHLLRSAYEARTQKQVPVLRRFFPKDKVDAVKAQYLDIILYTKEQVLKQNEATKSESPHKDIDYDYAIISVKPQNQEYQNPMDPITIFRNALSKQEGGSGHPFNREKYLESVKFWQTHALLK